MVCLSVFNSGRATNINTHKNSIMQFGLKQNGDLKIDVFARMTNEQIKYAIEQELTLQKVIVSPEQRKALKTYLNDLTNDDMFVDTCGEMITLTWGFEK